MDFNCSEFQQVATGLRQAEFQSSGGGGGDSGGGDSWVLELVAKVKALLQVAATATPSTKSVKTSAKSSSKSALKSLLKTAILPASSTSVTSSRSAKGGGHIGAAGGTNQADPSLNVHIDLFK